MNILFLLKSFEIGGLEVVTSVLANKFVDEGHNVTLWAFYEGKTSLTNRLDKRVNLEYGNGLNSGKDNVRQLRNVLTGNKIQVVINQWGLPFVPAYTLKKASKGLNVKTIAVYHNDPSSNGRTKEVEIALERCDNPLKRVFLKMKLYAFKQITAASMRYIYRNSDKFMVLSESFIKHFEDFTGIRNADKLIVQTNPITIDSEHYELDLSKKQKEIVYVGRIDNQQKRTSRVIEMWTLLEDKHPDWMLRIVGDGEERKNLEQLSRDLNLKRVVFEGFRQPAEYYKRASILVLTSEYEGFGLVIVEGMSFGVVPVVLGSYSAVYDILKNKENGIIVPYDKQAGFHAEEMVNEGVDIIDVGGESTRPGYTLLSDEEEINRVSTVIEKLKQNFDVPISLDTYKSKVAKAGIKAGADLINDIWGLKYDEALASVIAENNVSCCLMHNRNGTEYKDFLNNVVDEMKESLNIAKNAGIKDEKIILDPGIGFGKTYEQNLIMLNNLSALNKLGYPLLLGASRKSVIGNTLNLPTDERLEGTLVTSVLAVMNNYAFVRVHDVKANLRAVKMALAIRNSGGEK